MMKLILLGLMLQLPTAIPDLFGFDYCDLDLDGRWAVAPRRNCFAIMARVETNGKNQHVVRWLSKPGTFLCNV